MENATNWLQLGGVGGGGIAVTALFNWLRQRSKSKEQADSNQVQREALAIRRENELWAKVGELQARIDLMDKRLATLMDENTALKMQNLTLKVEVNDLLDDLGNPVRYPLESQIMRVAT